MDELETLVVRVRGDGQAFARDVAAMRGELEGPLARGADGASRAMQGGLERFVRTGKTGFEDLRKVALSALADIAGEAFRAAVGSGSGGGQTGVLSGLLESLIGLPGRATGGPVTGGRAYMVGERGPELFVPTGDGRVVAPGGGPRVANVTVNVSVPQGSGAAFMGRTGDQVARAVRRALVRAEMDG